MVTNNRYKKIDPFADTETAKVIIHWHKHVCYKKIDPFADTETETGFGLADPIACYKKIDPFADTETLKISGKAFLENKLQKNRSVCGY